MTTTATSPTVFEVGDFVLSNRHGGTGTVCNIVDHQPTGEPLLCITDGQCGSVMFVCAPGGRVR